MEADVVANDIQDGGTVTRKNSSELNKSQKDFLESCKYDDKKKHEEKCTAYRCTIGISERENRKIKCGSCYRTIHWECTQLPAYQIQQIINQGNTFQGYVCVSCTIVSDEVLEVCTKKTESGLQKTCIEQANQITSLQEELKMYKENQDNNLVATNESTKKKRKRGDEIPYMPLISEEDGENSVADKIEPATILIEMEKLFQKRFNDMEVKVTGIVEKRLKEVNNSSDVNNPNTSYAAVTATPSSNAPISPAADIKTVLRSSKNSELVEERDRKYRSKNIIIHGKVEDNDTEETDEDFVRKFLKDLCIGNIKHKHVTRLGVRNPFKTRPIKVSFENENDREKVLANLSNLKNHKEEYDKISFTADYTQSERAMIKEFATEAKAKNDIEPPESGFVWKVRGSPKNGIYLRRVPKVKTIIA